MDFGQEEEQQSNPDVAVLIGIENYTDLPDNPKGIKKPKSRSIILK